MDTTTAISRAELRRSCAARVRDLWELRATKLGSTTTFVDEKNLVYEANHFMGADMVFVSGSGANVGQTAYVSGSSQQFTTLTFTPQVPVVTDIGDAAELYNLRGQGLTSAEWNTLLNSAIYEVRHLASVKKQVELAAFDSDTPYLSIPTTIRYVSSLWYVASEAGVSRNMYPLPTVRDGNGWWVDPVNRLIRIEGSLTSDLDTYAPTVVGFGPPAPLYDDDDETEVHPGYLMARTCYLAVIAMQEKGRADLANLLGALQREYQDHSKQLRPGNFPPNTVRLH